MIRKSIAALGTAFALTIALSACGSSAGDSAEAPVASTGGPAERQETQQDAQQGATADGQADGQADGGAAGSGGGELRLTVDGAAVTIDDPEVSCVENDGMVSIGIVSKQHDASQGLGAIVTAGDAPTVSSVGLVSAEGTSVAFVNGSGMSSPTAVKTGSTYEITGEGLLTDANNPATFDVVPFEFIVTCP